MITVNVEAGAMVRGCFRKFMFHHGIDFTEMKGLLSSSFRVNCNKRQLQYIDAYLKEMGA